MRYGYRKTGNGAGRSSAWRNIDVDALKNDRNMGDYILLSPSRGWTDLTSNGSNGQATLVQATAGQLVVLDGDEGGWVQVDCNSTTDNQGATMFVPGFIVKPGAKRTVVIKGILRAKDLANGLQMFFGLVLSTLDTTPVTADAPASGATDYVGVYTTGNTGTAGVMKFAAEDGGTQGLSTLAFHTFLDGDTVTDGTEVVKVEIRINGTKNIELWIDGVKTPHDVGATAIPEDTALRIVLACLSAGTTDPILEWKEIEAASVPGVFG